MKREIKLWGLIVDVNPLSIVGSLREFSQVRVSILDKDLEFICTVSQNNHDDQKWENRAEASCEGILAIFNELHMLTEQIEVLKRWA